jgi:predicted GIY-YIG superfamily endonuclease
LVEYVNAKAIVKILCSEHGIFEQKPNNHLSGQGCPSCYGNAKLTTETFISKATQKHSSKYDYSLVNYINARNKVNIICTEHGIFEQTPNDHISGHGCPSCSVGGKLTTKNFISKANQKHKHIYDYSLVNYIHSHFKVKIICKEHGIFEQKPNNHLSGQGCPSCAIRGGFNQNKTAIFYILKIKDQDIYKIGITNKSVSERYSKNEQELFTIVRNISFKNGTDALNLENKLKRQYKEFLYKGINPLNSGHTEMFTVLPTSY